MLASSRDLEEVIMLSIREDEVLRPAEQASVLQRSVPWGYPTDSLGKLTKMLQSTIILVRGKIERFDSYR